MNTYLWHLDLCNAQEGHIPACFISSCQVCKQFTEAGFMADADLDSSCLLNKKIRNAQLAQYNFILGEKVLQPFVHLEALTDHWFESIFAPFLLLWVLTATTSKLHWTGYSHNIHGVFLKTVFGIFEIVQIVSPCNTDWVIHSF